MNLKTFVITFLAMAAGAVLANNAPEAAGQTNIPCETTAPAEAANHAGNSKGATAGKKQTVKQAPAVQLPKNP